MANLKNTILLAITMFTLAFGPISIDASGGFTPQDGCTPPTSSNCGG